MIDKLKHLLRLLKPEDTGQMHTPSDQEIVFYLTLKSVEIGQLSLRDGVWTYKYADSFMQQSQIPTLVDFPNAQKVYQAESLWPFFSSRIPTPNQPQVQDRLRRKSIDLTNTAEMLKEFGQRTIANPFSLQAAGQA